MSVPLCVQEKFLDWCLRLQGRNCHTLPNLQNILMLNHQNRLIIHAIDFLNVYVNGWCRCNACAHHVRSMVNSMWTPALYTRTWYVVLLQTLTASVEWLELEWLCMLLHDGFPRMIIALSSKRSSMKTRFADI